MEVPARATQSLSTFCGSRGDAFGAFPAQYCHFAAFRRAGRHGETPLLRAFSCSAQKLGTAFALIGSSATLKPKPTDFRDV
jgi:hypothetical protein